MVFGTIYRLVFPNNKCYIGQTHYTIEERFKLHYRDSKNGSQYPVHRAIIKYGKDNVIKELIDTVNIECQKTLDDLEIKYIKEYDSLSKNGKGYNQNEGGGGNIGYKFNEEQRKNASAAQQRRNIERPDIAQNNSIFMKQYHKDHPEMAENHSKKMKQYYKEHPEMAENHSNFLRQLYENEPERKIAMSELKKQQNIDNPEMAMRQKEIKLMMYEDKNAADIIQIIRDKAKDQWKDPAKRQKILDEKRQRFTEPEFCAYDKNGKPVRDENGEIKKFTYVPDCSIFLFGIHDPNVGAVLKGRRKICKGYTFKYCETNS